MDSRELYGNMSLCIDLNEVSENEVLHLIENLKGKVAAWYLSGAKDRVKRIMTEAEFNRLNAKISDAPVPDDIIWKSIYNAAMRDTYGDICDFLNDGFFFVHSKGLAVVMVKMDNGMWYPLSVYGLGAERAYRNNDGSIVMVTNRHGRGFVFKYNAENDTFTREIPYE